VKAAEQVTILWTLINYSKEIYLLHQGCTKPRSCLGN